MSESDSYIDDDLTPLIEGEENQKYDEDYEKLVLVNRSLKRVYSEL